MAKQKSLCLALISSVALSSCLHTPKSTNTSEVQIFRDDYGTPHIVAADNYGVYFGYGYALATDRMFQLEMLKRTVQGQVSEALGEKYIALDTHIRTGYDHRAVRTQLESLSKKDRQLLTAYAAGFSKRIAEVLKDKNQLPKEFSYYQFEPTTWTDYDVAMLFVGAIAHRYSDFNSELDNQKLVTALTNTHGAVIGNAIFDASKWLFDDDSPTTVPRPEHNGNSDITAKIQHSDLSDTPATKRIAVNVDGKFIGSTSNASVQTQFNNTISEHGFGFSPEFAPASNFWAVQDLSDAKAAFVNGPQFGWSTPSYVYGIGLHGGDFNVVGNTLLGLPTLLFAHNNVTAWGSTAGLSDQVDVYVEKLNPDNSEQYWHNGVFKDYDIWQETIQVRDKQSITVTARRSVHGMVQHWQPKNNRAYTRARSWEGGEIASLMAWVNLAKDKTLEAMQDTIGDVTTNINFYTMDVAGNIAFTHGGRYPIRVTGHDSRLPVSGDGSMDWQGFLPYKQNPTVTNPKQGYISNWNNRPSAQWPSSDLWPLTWARTDRVDLINNEILAGKHKDVAWLWDINKKISYDDVSSLYLLPYLKFAIEGSKLTQTQRQALDTLLSWNQEWSVDNEGYFGAGATIMEAWHRTLLQQTFADDIPNEFMHLYSATHTPNKALGPSMGTPPGTRALIRNLDRLTSNQSTEHDFFNGNYKKVLRKSFADAVTELASNTPHVSDWRLKAWSMTWKPFNFRGVPQAMQEDTVSLPTYMNRGSENNLFIAKGDHIQAFDVIPPGQTASGENSNDQMSMFAGFKHKDVHFDIEAVKAHSKTQQTVRYTQ